VQYRLRVSPLLAEATSVALLAVGASGWGRLIPQGWLADGAKSRVATSYLVGWLLFGSLYAIGATLHPPLGVAVWCTAVAAGLGLLFLARVTWSDRSSLVRHGIVGLAIAAYWVLGATIAGNEAAIDPWFYAASPFILFESDWLATNISALPNAVELANALQIVAFSRASASVALWPIALVSDGIGVGQVVQAGVGLLLIACWLCADLVRRSAELWVAALLGVGAIGVFNVIAIVPGGQLQQAVALLTALSCLWLGTALASAWRVAVVQGVGGFLLSSTYPEFLIALPLYAALLAVLRRQPPRETLVQVAALAGGFAAYQAFSGGASLMYMLGQSTAAPGWSPLQPVPRSPLELIVAVVLQTRPPFVALLVVAVAGALFWMRRRPQAPWSVPRHAFVLVGLGCVVWALAVLRSPKPDYAVFKLGGWLGPGIILLAWFCAGALAANKRRFARTCVVVFVAARSAALLYAGQELLHVGRVELAQQWPREFTPDGGCSVQVDTREVFRTAAGIAASAAPFRGCSLRPQAPPGTGTAQGVP
jgi:hypothetical protein